jgi:dTDP-4-dehydrorhamnose 3,5-epimerase
MKLIRSSLPDVLIVEPRVFGDDRGYFFESYNERELEKLGLRARFVQDNHSRSAKGVLRGLHYQLPHPQGKLVRAVVGEIFDVAVDMRRSSPHFGKWTGHHLSADNKRQMWVPEGFAHGFLTVSDVADVLYKATDYYAPHSEHCVLYSDPALAIEWPKGIAPILSAKDAAARPLADSELFD